MAPMMGKKSIGLMMLTIIGLFPAVFALNPAASQGLSDLPNIAQQTEPLIEKYGDDKKGEALKAAKALEDYKAEPRPPASLGGLLRLREGQGGKLGVASETAKERAGVRDNVYTLIAQLKHAEEIRGISEQDKKERSRFPSSSVNPSNMRRGGSGSSARCALGSAR